MAVRVQFGDFVLDFDSRELRRAEEPLKLSPKALQLLEILATNRPKALSKAEFQDRLWPGTTSPRTPPPFQMAVVHIGLEDWDQAFDRLERAVDGSVSRRPVSAQGG